MLASGSSGNAALLATDNTRILVDAGLSMKELGRRLAPIGEDLERLDAILITHEHSDHVSGLPVLARSKKVRAPIYMTRLTAPAIDWGECEPRAGAVSGRRQLSRSATSKCKASASRTTRIDPVGFCFEAQGVRIGVATDLGYIPESIKFHLRRDRPAAAGSQSRSGHAESGTVSLVREAAGDEPGGASLNLVMSDIWRRISIRRRRT